MKTGTSGSTGPARTSGTRVLAVDDEPPILRALATNLRARGYDVDLATTGEAALELASRHPPDVVILDLGLPGMSGLEVIQGLRGWSTVPILILSAREAQGDKVAALDAGADDYVTKPFGIDELLARLRAALRRAEARHEPVIELGELSIDLDKRAVHRDGERIQLTPHEYALLRVFALNTGRLLTHGTILREVWGRGYESESHYLHVYISQLRRKIERNPTRPRYLLTEPGAGYRLVDPSDRGS
ncbi:MAG: response regulator transcription factor [Actinomycetota bacterium]|nr:response regulator transcription factor [Actinomycetota bacterium]